MVSVLSLTAVDHWFELRSGHTKDCKIYRFCGFSSKHAVLEWCNLVYWSSEKQTLSSSYQKVICSCHHIPWI